MISALDALERLREGNRRFVSGDVGGYTSRRSESAADQAPFAIVLGCSDSRVPVELVFDQGPGDLFVIRVAGNIVTPTQLGSVEFATAQFGTRLVVVLGHSRCGAVIATLEELEHSTAVPSSSIQSITREIRPSVETLVQAEGQLLPDDLLRRAVRSNVDASVGRLRNGSQILGRLSQHDGLVVVGAEFSLETGIVDFYED